jgi:hypothetical protein
MGRLSDKARAETRRWYARPRKDWPPGMWHALQGDVAEMETYFRFVDFRAWLARDFSRYESEVEEIGARARARAPRVRSKALPTWLRETLPPDVDDPLDDMFEDLGRWFRPDLDSELQAELVTFLKFELPHHVLAELREWLSGDT